MNNRTETLRQCQHYFGDYHGLLGATACEKCGGLLYDLLEIPTRNMRELLKYTQHYEFCALNMSADTDDAIPAGLQCTCGLTPLLARLSATVDGRGE